MWLCNDEVEEKPRLHTLHLNGLLELEVGIKRKNCQKSDSEIINYESKAIMMIMKQK